MINSIDFTRSKGSSIVPEVSYQEIDPNGGRFSEAAAELIRKRGCVVVKGLLPKDEAEEMRSELMEYLSANNVNVEQVDASPIKDVFWSKAQVMGGSTLGLELTTWHSTWNIKAALAKQGNQVVKGLLYLEQTKSISPHFAAIKYIRRIKNIFFHFILLNKIAIS